MVTFTASHIKYGIGTAHVGAEISLEGKDDIAIYRLYRYFRSIPGLEVVLDGDDIAGRVMDGMIEHAKRTVQNTTNS